MKRLNRAIAPPSRLEDLFALAYHAWCLGGSADDEDQHVHLCRPGNTLTMEVLEDIRPLERPHTPPVINPAVPTCGRILCARR